MVDRLGLLGSGLLQVVDEEDEIVPLGEILTGLQPDILVLIRDLLPVADHLQLPRLRADRAALAKLVDDPEMAMAVYFQGSEQCWAGNPARRRR